ncbi:putative biotin carboxylase [Thiomonas arsenitoxydans]|jgi:biotin carboxylase|uniref:Biotin carboxylase n=1 Tax=Thiomonas arsenitoxydans (strain DSM 22701 / CIP 110005 / 3As) TaxID=426114 RepID=D6CSY6_THIA3|nr:biotin carboxylase [Thiomonas arsenitoxydans]CAZ88405.1 Putative biotin carboxylase [Thiomonas arsenitoxydans]CQR33506.1 putative biotin carboxylase [Thiomonas arsenitoxydans]CQR33778.1 putative biotin carboxylase [Thiomonas arsenitoxydans]
MSYVLCLHRWVGNQALYDRYELPADMKIRAICTSESVASLPTERLASWTSLPSLDDAIAVRKEAEQFVTQHGVPALVVALNEGDLLNAASIRERWGVPGDHVAWTERFRDKLKMLEIAEQQTAIGVLPAVRVQSQELVEQLATKHGYPLVLKPRYGTASRGVKILRNLGDVQKLEATHAEPMMVQVYCAAPILHVDGWWDGQHIVVATVSRYVNSCADFGPESPLASIELEEGDHERRITNRVAQLLEVFAPHREIVFHLELFDRGNELLFLEIGARVGGAEIPFIWREIRGIDLIGIAWELQTGASTHYRDLARNLSRNGRPLLSERGAWVIARRSSALRDNLESLYWSQPQSVEHSASGVYEGSKTRLRLRSFQRTALERSVRTVFEQLSKPESGGVQS